MTEALSSVIVGVLALLGTLCGSYMSNRRSTALLNYRLEQLEKKVDRLEERLAGRQK